MLKHWSQGQELGIALLLCLGLFVSIPLDRGGLGLSWDSMNHHVYLGWIASQSRFGLDFFAAGTQSYQFPYLFWPIYKMNNLGFPGWLAGVVWACLHAMIIVPLWLISRALIPGMGFLASVFRLIASLYGVFSILVLRAAETTGTDVLAAMPFVWGIAIAIGGIKYQGENKELRESVYRSALTGALGGVSVALKLSNGVLVFVLPLLCLFYCFNMRTRIWLATVCSLCILLSFSILYGWWGWQLWVHFGNPVFPFYDSIFEPVRAIFAWQTPAIP